jgi:hypothetical protein
MIHHGIFDPAIAPLTITMILTPLLTLPVPPVRLSLLLPPSLLTAQLAAVSLPSIAWPAYPEHLATKLPLAKYS